MTVVAVKRQKSGGVGGKPELQLRYDKLVVEADFCATQIDPTTSDFVLATDDVYYHAVSVRYSNETWAAKQFAALFFARKS